MTARTRLRRLSMGLATLAGRPRGFFSPYRHAASVVAPAGYPSLAPVFERAFAAPPTGAMAVPADVIAAIRTHAGRLAAFDGPPPEPRWDQSWYPRLDGVAAYAIVREVRPARVIEVGSGHSTRFLARALADAGQGSLACIDPAPRAGLDGLGVRWERRLLSADDVETFAALAPGDVAFFDSSHLLWPGSDVDLILNAILPVLAPGVLVHLHDVFLPDPYPADWAWRGYTEQLGLAGWLCGAARLLWSSHWALRTAFVQDPAVARLPLPDGARESALWLVTGRGRTDPA